MAKIYPRTTLSSIPSTSRDDLISKKQLVFTIWMRSLILGCNGCTVFDFNGEIVYRVDNYNDRQNNEVYLMDSRGKVLFTILKKKLNMLGCWKGYRSSEDSESGEKGIGFGKLEFQVKRSFSFRRWKFFCEVKLGFDHEKYESCCYEIQRCKKSKIGKYKSICECDRILRRSTVLKKNLTMCKIIDNCGSVIVEAKRKRSTGGIDLGGDVLTMEVDPTYDRGLVMGLIVGYSLLDSKM